MTKNFLVLTNFLKKLVETILFLSLVACTITPPSALKLPEPLRAPTHSRAEPTPPTEVKDYNAERETKFLATPDYPSLQTTIVDDSSFDAPPILKGEPVSINVENIPLPAFINEIFGNLLKLSFQISPDLQKKDDLVTLRITEPQKPEQLYDLARQVLETYGITIMQQRKLLHFLPSNKASTPPPLLISGRTLPDVPASHRPIFQFVPLKVVSANSAKSWLNKIYPKHGLQVQSDSESNTLMLFGKTYNVQQALNAIALFDQPHMRSRHSVRIEPTFISAKELSEGLVNILNSQGYAVSSTPNAPNNSVIVLPVPSVNAVIVFASDLNALDQVKKWAISLDKQGYVARGDTIGLFFYPVQNTHAKELVNILNPLLTGIVSNTESEESSESSKITQNFGGIAGKSSFVVDEIRNAIIFQGKASTWVQLLPIMQKIDQPSKLVLIEVIVAEITLSETERFGFDFLMKGLDIGGKLGGTFSTLSGTTGLYTLDSAGQTRAILEAFAENSRVNLLSSPRIMVKSGESASISSGTEVPIITTQSASNQQQLGNSIILQQIQYRKTGTILSIKPSVYAGNRVDIELTQEISRALPLSEGNAINSPAILNRKIQTILSLEDGGSVLLGGLIDVDRSDGDAGVPVLRDLPLFGGLFRSKNRSDTRTELLMMIVPYVIDNQSEAEEITDVFRQRLHLEGVSEEILQKESKSESN